MTWKPSRRVWRRVLGGLAALTVLSVWIGYQFPSVFLGRKSSVEILQQMFQAPATITEEHFQAALRRINKKAVSAFIKGCGLPDDVEGRLLQLVQGDRIDRVTLPFVLHLYELYGATLSDQPVPTDDLAYPGDPVDRTAGKKAPSDSLGLSELARSSPKWKRHLTRTLLLFDAVFLRVAPGAEGQPVNWRYDESAYEDVKEVIRQLARERSASASAESRQAPSEPNSMAGAFEEILRDDEQLTAFVEFFVDFVRELTDGWLDGFQQREARRERRLAWVEDRIAAGRYYEIADYAAARAERRLAVHIAVDGLQGKLLEGLAELSSGEVAGSGARYVQDLVQRCRRPAMQPETYPPEQRSALPPLGADIVSLAQDEPAPRPDFLENFKRYVYSGAAQSAVVSVATVDTPTISVRNLPIIYTGHRVAGDFGTGVPNFSYLDRRTGRGWYFWGSDILHFRRIVANREAEIQGGQNRPGPGARTLFERLWRYNTVSAMPTLDRGALEKISAEVGTALGEIQRDFIETVILTRFRRRAAAEAELNLRRCWLRDHRRMSEGFLAELIFSPVELATFRDYARYLAEFEDDGLPDYLLWYNPWPDHFAHGKGPYSDAIVGFKGEYDRLDHYLGKLVQAYHDTPTGAGQSSYATRTLFGVVSDHGLVYTPRRASADELLFESLRRDGVQIRVHKLTRDEGELPALHGRKGDVPQDCDVVVGSTAGGSYILDIVAPDRATTDSVRHGPHLDFHQLRKHTMRSGQTLDWIDTIEKRLGDVLDIAVVREYGPAEGETWPDAVESVARLFDGRGRQARVYRERDGAESSRRLYRYEVLGAGDPLRLAESIQECLISTAGPSRKEIERGLKRCLESKTGSSDAEWQRWLSYTSRPDAIFQLSQLYDTDRAGTINVFPAATVGLNSQVPGRHVGETFGEKNGTQLYFGAGLRRATIQTARNGSVPVTLFHWLVGDRQFRAADSASGASPADQFGFESLLSHPALAPAR